MSIEFFTRLPLHGETQFLPGDPRNRGDWHAGGASTGAVSGFAVGDHFTYIDYLGQIARAAEAVDFGGALWFVFVGGRRRRHRRSRRKLRRRAAARRYRHRTRHTMELALESRQGLCQLRAVLETLRRLLREQLVEHRLQHRKVRRQLRQGCGDVHDAHRERILGLIRHAPEQQLMEHDTERVQVGATVERQSTRLFGTHVVRRADDGAGVRHARVVGGTRNAEVGEHRGAVFAQQDVVGLDVAVDHALALGIAQRRGDLARHAQREGQVARRAVAGQHRAAGQVFHRDVVGITHPSDVVHLHHVRVLELGRDSGFAQEALTELLVAEQGGRHHLQRHFALHRFLQGQIHGGHAATAERSQDAVSGNFDHSPCPCRLVEMNGSIASAHARRRLRWCAAPR